MPTEFEVLRDLILVASALEQRLDKISGNETIQKIVQEVDRNYPQWATKQVLEKMMADDRAKLLERRCFIHLPIIKDGMDGATSIVPIVSFDIDFTKTPPTVQILLIPYILETDETGAANVRTVAMRFESPHSGGHGIHDYYHMQFVTTAREKEENAIYNCPPWIPATTPALPIFAEDPIQLFICAFVSLYGRVGFARYFEKWPDLSDYTKKMPIFKRIAAA